MRDLRFTGRISNYAVDVTLRTDAINATDENFNIMSIQTGRLFNVDDVKDARYQQFMGAFKTETSTLTICKSFATTYGLDLVSYNTNGSDRTFIINDPDISDSASKF